MKKYILLIISLINIAVTGVFIAFNPNEELPSHYNVNGIADAYSSKWMLLFIPSILVLFSIIYAILYMRFTQRLKKMMKTISHTENMP